MTNVPQIPPPNFDISLLTNSGGSDASDNSISRSPAENKNPRPMIRSMSQRQTIGDLKIALGFRRNTHWKTILNNPGRKLRPYIYPGMDDKKARALVTELINADAQKKSAMRREAQKRTRIYFEEEEEKKREEEKKQREARAKKREEKAFIAGQKTQITYQLEDLNDISVMLNTYLPAIQRGEKFLILVGEIWYTLSLSKYEDLVKLIESMMIEEVAEFIDSDTEIIATILHSQSVTIQRPKERVGATYNIRDGEFFPYTHDFNDPDLVTELANLGCWMTVEPENYNNNCLWLACKSAGLSYKTLEAMKFEFLQRKISRKNIRKIAERHNLCVKIRTDGDKNIIVYGNEKAEDVTKVELAIITNVAGDHYIHLYETKFTSYSILNYDQVKDRKNWYSFVTNKERKHNRGMNSLDLLRTILKTNHCKAIDISTEGIFRTQFYDRFKTSEFITLEYVPEYATPFHEARSGEPHKALNSKFTAQGFYPSEQLKHLLACEELGKVRKAIMNKKGGDKVLKVLDSKFTAQGFGPAEQLKHLKRALRNLVDAEIFFDFEASPYETHEDYVCRYSEFNEEEIHEVRTLADAERSGEGFLKQLLAKYGAVDPNNGKKFEPPTIKLLAHNLTYDYSFIAPYLKRVDLTERGTKIICGSALYSEVIETPMLNKPNNQILQWLKENGPGVKNTGF